MIWSRSFEERLVYFKRIRVVDHAFDQITGHPRRPTFSFAPLAFSICRESRAYALTRYTLIGKSGPKVFREVAYDHPTSVWYNPDVDILELLFDALDYEDDTHYVWDPPFVCKKRWVKTLMVNVWLIPQWLAYYFDLRNVIESQKDLKHYDLTFLYDNYFERCDLIASPSIPNPETVRLLWPVNYQEVCPEHFLFGTSSAVKYRVINPLEQNDAEREYLFENMKLDQIETSCNVLGIEVLHVKAYCRCRG